MKECFCYCKCLNCIARSRNANKTRKRPTRQRVPVVQEKPGPRPPPKKSRRNQRLKHCFDTRIVADALFRTPSIICKWSTHNRYRGVALPCVVAAPRGPGRAPPAYCAAERPEPVTPPPRVPALDHGVEGQSRSGFCSSKPQSR